MQKEVNTFLKIIDFTQLVNWSSYALLGKDLIYTQKYPFVRIGDFLKRNKEAVKIQDEVSYKRATIRINGNGISLRDTVLGKVIGTKNQFIIHAGQFLLSKIDARNGAFGVVTEELEGGIITGNFWTFDVDYSRINPHYLTLLTGTKEFQKLSQSASVGTTNRNYLQENQFLNFKIPLPSIEQQQEIVDSFNKNILHAKANGDAAFDLETSIDSYLFEELAIKKIEKHQRSHKLNIIEFYNLERWGAEFNSIQSRVGTLHSFKYKNEKLKNLIEINPLTKYPKIDIEISFIPMECVSDKSGEIVELRVKKAIESKGYTKFQEGDLIWARITPCMENGKSAIAKGLLNGFGCGSTEFHVLRNSKKVLDLNYVHLLLRTPTVLENASRYFTGSAGQQRVPKSYLENLEIPIPPINKQIEIVEYVSAIKDQIKILKAQEITLIAQAEKDLETTLFSSK